MRTDKRRRIRSAIAFLGLSVLIGIPGWLTYREFQKAKASAALIGAIERQNTAQVASLLAEGADANATDLPIDTRSLWQRTWDSLRKKPTPPAPTALLLALSRYVYHDGRWYTNSEDDLPENPRLVQLLLDYGADPNCREPFAENAESPLMVASTDFKWETARVLLRHGADVNASSYQGFTPLLLAAFHNSPEMVDTLLHQGAQANVKERNSGWSPLMYAIAFRNAPMLKSLLHFHADLNLKSDDGQTPLTYARTLSDELEIIRLLKNAGAK